MTSTLAALSEYLDWLNTIKQGEPAIWQQAVARLGQQTVDQSFGQLHLPGEKSQP